MKFWLFVHMERGSADEPQQPVGLTEIAAFLLTRIEIAVGPT